MFTRERVFAKIASIKKKPVRKKIKKVVYNPKIEVKEEKKRKKIMSILANKKLKASKRLELVINNLKK